MDESALYKRMCFRAREIQESWVPEVGDFWYCACGSCLMSKSIWVIERPDVMAIDPKYTFENLKTHYHRDTVAQVMTSRDCGFGPFWFHWKLDGECGVVWLPRFDQLMKFTKLNGSISGTTAWQLASFLEYVRSIDKADDEPIEQLALRWIMEVVYNKRYKENPDKPVIQDEPPEPIVAPEDMPDDLAEMYKIVRMPRKKCGGDWFEIKTS